MPTFNLKSKVDKDFDSGMKYALISIVGPDAQQKSKIPAVAIRGFANSEDEIEQVATMLKESNDLFDIVAVDMGYFVPLEYSDKQLKKVEYDNPSLNQLMKEIKEHSADGKKEFEKRKKQLRSGKVPKDHVISTLKGVENDIKSSLELKKLLEDKLKQMNERGIEYDDNEN